jgi:hypothetical protein
LGFEKLYLEKRRESQLKGSAGTPVGFPPGLPPLIKYQVLLRKILWIFFTRSSEELRF